MQAMKTGAAIPAAPIPFSLLAVPKSDFYDLHFHHSVADFRQEAEKS